MGFTGGGGDGDTEDSEERISAAHAGGVQTGSLNANTFDKWMENGWYNLFHDRYVSSFHNYCHSLTLSTSRYSTSSKVERAIVRNSAAPLSDQEALEDEDIKEIKPSKQKGPRREPGGSSLDRLVDLKVKEMERKQSRIEVERMHAGIEEKKLKVDLVRGILSTGENLDAAVKDKANRKLEKLLDEI